MRQNEKMRRSDRKITLSEAEKLLMNSGYGILSTIGDNGQPYGVPLNFTYKNNHIYFHCAISGRKTENICNNSKVSFCIVGETEVLADKFTTKYESVIVFGIASEVQGTEKNNALLWLLEKYSTDYIDEGKLVIQKQSRVTKVIKIEIDSISGKANR